MHPVLGEIAIGDAVLTIRAYGALVVIAAIVAVALAARAARAPAIGLPARRAVALYGAAIGAGLVGARLLDVALDPGAYVADPGAIVAPAFRGFALPGGLAVASLIAVGGARRMGVQAGALADSAIGAAAAGIVLLRVGCFLNGCCAGIATDVPWGVTFPATDGELGVLEGVLPGVTAHVDAVHPTQLYEAAAAIGCAVVATVVRRASRPPGMATLVFVAGFLALRAGNQLLRADPAGAVLPGSLLAAVYACAAAAAAILLVRAFRARPPVVQSPSGTTSRYLPSRPG